MLVHNDVMRDARVLKEADSLALVGHDVNVVGLGEKDGLIENRASGATVEWLYSDVNRLLTIKFILVTIGLVSGIRRNRTYCLVATHIVVIVALLIFLNVGWALLYAACAVADTLLRSKSPLRKMVAASCGLLLKGLRWCLTKARGKLKTIARTESFFNRGLIEPIDVVHCHDWVALPAAIKIKKKTGCKLVWDAHEIYEDVAQSRPAYYTEFIKVLLGRSQQYIDMFITINSSIAEFYKTNYPRLPEAVVIKNSVPNIPGHRYDGRLHKRANLPREQKILLYQGGYAEKRGLHDTVEMARFLRDDMTLVMMGWGGIETTLKAAATQIVNQQEGRVYPSIVFIPPAPHAELIEWTSGANVGLILYENIGLNHLYCTPNKLWEYPAAGVPILCTPLVEMKKAIERWSIGWSVDADTSPKIMAEQVNGISDEMFHNAVGRCETYMQNDGWHIYEESLVSMYKNLES